MIFSRGDQYFGVEVKFLNHRKMKNCGSICQGIVLTTLWEASWKPGSGESRRLQSSNLKEVTEGHHQEGNLRLNLTQQGKSHHNERDYSL